MLSREAINQIDLYILYGSKTSSFNEMCIGGGEKETSKRCRDRSISTPIIDVSFFLFEISKRRKSCLWQLRKSSSRCEFLSNERTQPTNSTTVSLQILIVTTILSEPTKKIYFFNSHVWYQTSPDQVSIFIKRTL